MTPALRIARALFVLASLTTLSIPVPAGAGQGLNLAWFHCSGEGTGTQNAVFACNTNAGLHSLVGSFVLTSDMSQVIGTEIILQLAADSPTLPAWWQFKNTGTCRSSALSVLFFADPTNNVCFDWSSGLSNGGLGAYCTVDFPCAGAPPAPNAATIKVIHAVPPLEAAEVFADVENYDFTLNISNAKTVGTGACGGCNVPVCIVLNSINVVAKDNVEHRFLSTPTVPGSNYVTWQGGGNPNVGGTIGCPAATPTQRSTWGRVKSLYR